MIHYHKKDQDLIVLQNIPLTHIHMKYWALGHIYQGDATITFQYHLNQISKLSY